MIVFFMQPKGVGEADTFERYICISLHDSLVGGFDVDGGNIICKEKDLIGMDLRAAALRAVVFSAQIRGRDQT